jgi:hypothetical protein
VLASAALRAVLLCAARTIRTQWISPGKLLARTLTELVTTPRRCSRRSITWGNVPRFYFGEQSIVAPSQHYVVEHFSLALEVGRKTNISAGAVRVHLGHIFNKLHVRCRIEAAAKYLSSRQATRSE